MFFLLVLYAKSKSNLAEIIIAQDFPIAIFPV